MNIRWRSARLVFGFALLLGLPAVLSSQSITNRGRVTWFVRSTIGPASLSAGLFSAGAGTWLDRPKEYDTHWRGFYQRFGMRLTGVATSNALEAGLGTVTREDPRYHPSNQSGLLGRVRHAATLTVMAYHKDGNLRPAYARFGGIVSGNFLSNTWRVPSESTTRMAAMRVGLGFAGKFVSNLFDEFRPRH